MTSHAYEVALFAAFSYQDLPAVLNRLTLHSESALQMHVCELVFEPYGVAHSHIPGSVDQTILLRARRELLETEAKWMLYSYLKAESARVHSEATVRPWATCQIVGDAITFASALGYIHRSQLFKRGYVFRRGNLVIEMFQQEYANKQTGKPEPARPETLWEVEVKTAAPVRNSQATPLSKSIEAVLEVQLLMKGLLDLERKD